MKKIIKIGKPYITQGKSDIFGESVKLCAKVTFENPNNNQIETKECYFEFEKKYKKYLCIERSDAFVMGLLTAAMENDMDIEYETPISERLYYQLMTYYIPMVAKYNSKYPMNNIKLMGPTDSKIISNEHAVATGCSGGVDTFYTIAKHVTKIIPKSNRLTHIIYSSSCTSDFIDQRVKDIYISNLNFINNIAKECNVISINCYNNLYEFYKIPFRGFNMFFTTTFSSVAFSLQKLISIYYASSGTPIEYFNIDIEKTKGWDGSAIDIFTVANLNTENLSVYSTGIEVNRNEKIKYIADYKPAQNNLKVCGMESSGSKSNNGFNNCSHCKKCLRTMFSLYAINKLDSFNKVFDTKSFRQNINKNIGKLISIDHNSFTKESISLCKQNKVKISFKAYMYAYLYYKPIKILKKIFHNSLIVRKIYYKLNLDYKLDGYRDPSYDYYKEKINKK